MATRKRQATDEETEEGGRSESPSVRSGVATPLEPSSNVTIPDDELAEMRKGLVKMALCYELGRNIIKRQDITKAVIYPRKATANLFKKVIYLANSDLEEKFGMKLVPLPNRSIPDQFKPLLQPENNNSNKSSNKRRATETPRDSTPADSSSSTNPPTDMGKADRFVVKSVLPESYKQAITTAIRPRLDVQYMGLVTTIVMLIAMEGGVVSRTKLINEYLMDLFGSAESTSYGSHDSVINAMKRKNYILQHRDESSTGEPILYFSLGPRSMVEYSTESILKLLQQDSLPANELQKLKKRLSAVFNED